MPRTDSFGHGFRDAGLLEQALTHASAGSRNNERLEFLGDGLVNLIIAEALFQRWPRADEGALTRARAELVREAALARVARELEVGPRLIFGPGELKSGAHRRDSILADAVEALIAAIYLDAGFERCREVVLSWFDEAIASLPVGKVEKDAKTQLQEWLQGRQRPLPVYELVEATGEDHERHFRARCALGDQELAGEGEGASRRVAEQAAAAIVLEALKGADAKAKAERAARRGR